LFVAVGPRLLSIFVGCLALVFFAARISRNLSCRIVLHFDTFLSYFHLVRSFLSPPFAMSSSSYATLSAVRRHAEPAVIAELRAAVAEARAATAAAESHAAQMEAAWLARHHGLMDDAVALAEQALAAGLEGELLDEYAPLPPPCDLCGGPSDDESPLTFCAGCLAPLLACGWCPLADADRANCQACGDEGEGFIGGRTR
jgi:hypothetical protein